MNSCNTLVRQLSIERRDPPPPSIGRIRVVYRGKIGTKTVEIWRCVPRARVARTRRPTVRSSRPLGCRVAAPRPSKSVDPDPDPDIEPPPRSHGGAS